MSFTTMSYLSGVVYDEVGMALKMHSNIVYKSCSRIIGNTIHPLQQQSGKRLESFPHLSKPKRYYKHVKTIRLNAMYA